MKKREYFREYCCGCGLCKDILDVPFFIDGDGFEKPDFGKCDELEFEKLKKFCPSSYKYTKDFNGDSVWGKYKKVEIGYSTDKLVREKGSSGGVLSSISIFLLENDLVDAVIHTGASLSNPLKTRTVISRNKEEILKNSGSRYFSSSPLIGITEILRKEKRCAFVGKPCDVNALKMWIIDNIKYDINNYYFLSFFCMGVPSYQANLRLLDYLNVKIKDLKSISYRGDGWPGFTKVIDKDLVEKKTDYNTSWGKILGRDLRKSCKICADGIGENADVSCADAWYTDKDNNPLFSESLGRNIIFARNDRGLNILQAAIEKNYIKVEAEPNYIENLKFIQKSQYDRRVTLISRFLALHIFNKKIYSPRYSLLINYSKNAKKARLLKIFLGSIKRVLKREL